MRLHGMLQRWQKKCELCCQLCVITKHEKTLASYWEQKDFFEILRSGDWGEPHTLRTHWKEKPPQGCDWMGSCLDRGSWSVMRGPGWCSYPWLCGWTSLLSQQLWHSPKVQASWFCEKGRCSFLNEPPAPPRPMSCARGMGNRHSGFSGHFSLHYLKHFLGKVVSWGKGQHWVLKFKNITWHPAGVMLQ